MNPSEIKGLRFSLYGSLIMAALGVGLAVWTRSQAVLLVGVYNLIAVIITAFAIRITKLLDLPEKKRYPAGYVAFEPFFILIKGFLLLVLTLVIIGSNIVILLNGGYNLNFGQIVFYILITLILNLVAYLFVRKVSQKSSSPILELEKENWQINLLITLGVAISFIVVFIFQDRILDSYLLYIDQVIVILGGLILLTVSYKVIRQGLRELLLVSPDESLKARVQAVIHRKLQGTSLINWNAVVLKTGRKIWVMLYLNPEKEQIPTDFGDKVKELLSPGLEEISQDYNVDVIVTRKV